MAVLYSSEIPRRGCYKIKKEMDVDVDSMLVKLKCLWEAVVFPKDYKQIVEKCK